MPQDVKIWEVGDNDSLAELPVAELNLEERLENWLEKDISIVSDDLLVIGRQVETDFGGKIDLLCLDRQGDLVIVELKRDRTPREIVAQVLDYASWVKDLSVDKIGEISSSRAKEDESLEQVFNERFGVDLPDSLNQNHRMYIVASELDSSTERVVNYLSDYGIGINAVTFRYFEKDDKEFLARVFLVEPEIAIIRSKSKRRRNLTEKELKEIANSHGVGELYFKLVEGLSSLFDRTGTTRSSMAFIGRLQDRMVAIFSLIPVESTDEDGLSFQVYVPRFATYFNVEEATLDSILPSNKKEWKYWKDAPPEYSGYKGFFKEKDEVQRFLDGLAKSKR